MSNGGGGLMEVQEAAPMSLPKLVGDQAAVKVGCFLLRAHQPTTTKQAKHTKEKAEYKIWKAIPCQ